MDWLFSELGFWHWLILGVLLIILELTAPGVVFLWVGLAALIVGLIKLIFVGLAWQYQVLIFAALAVAVTVVGRLLTRGRVSESDQPTLNRRGEQYVGRVLTLSQAVENGIGKVTVDDSLWKVECAEDMAVGGKVRVIGVDGTILKVEKA